ATQILHDSGQSIWLDYITRDLLDSGALKQYIDEFSVTGLTSNPTIFDHAINNSVAYDRAIAEKSRQGKSFVKSWNDLLAVISSKSSLLNKDSARKTAG